MMLRQIPIRLSIGVALMGCGGDSSGPQEDPAIAAAGSYSMVTYNGISLPAFIGANQNLTLEMIGGTEVLRADHTYEETWVLRETDNPGYGCECVKTNTEVVDDGTFDLVGTQITFHPSFADVTYTGEVSNGVLTYTDGPLVLKYQK